MRRPALWISAFLLLSVFFGWKTWGVLTTPLESGKPGAADGPMLSPGGGDRDPLPGADLASAVPSIVARPVFRSDRRPFEEGGDSPAGPSREWAKELQRFTVLGVILFQDANLAVISGKTAGGTERFEVGAGDSLSGFTVKEVREDGVLLTADGKEFLLPLYAGAPKAPARGGLRTEVAVPQAQPSPGAVSATPASPPPSAGPAPAPPGADAVREVRPFDRIQQRGKRIYPSRDRGNLTQRYQGPARTPAPFPGTMPSPFKPANP